MTYLDSYEITPRTTDPVEIIAEKDLAIGWLIGELGKADDVIRHREQLISQLLAEDE